MARVEAETGDDEYSPELDSAIESVKRFDNGSAAVEPLIHVFKNKSNNVHWAARYALLKLAPDSTRQLVRILSDVSKEVELRKGAAWTLGWMRDRDTVPALVAALDDDEQKVRSTATWALAQLAPESKVALPRFRELSRDPDATQRRWVAFALSFLGADAKEAIPELVELLADSDAGARELATNALEQIGPDARAAVPALVTLLQAEDTTGEIRSGVADALRAIGRDAAPAVPALVACLKDDALRVRYAAVEALGSIGTDAVAALPALIECLNDEHIRDEVVEAIKKIDAVAADRLGLH